MPLLKGCNPNHPLKGSHIRVEPIRTLQAIRKIKQTLIRHPRNFALFSVGINTAFRASDLISIRVRDVRYLNAGDELELKERKTGKNRRVSLNRVCIDAIQKLLWTRDYANDDFLFLGLRGQLTVPTVNNLVKQWCANAGLKRNYGSHTLRKTWGYHQRKTFNVPIPLLMQAFGHSSQQQTLEYLCIQPEEIKLIYANEL